MIQLLLKQTWRFLNVTYSYCALKFYHLFKILLLQKTSSGNILLNLVRMIQLLLKQTWRFFWMSLTLIYPLNFIIYSKNCFYFKIYLKSFIRIYITQLVKMIQLLLKPTWRFCCMSLIIFYPLNSIVYSKHCFYFKIHLKNIIREYFIKLGKMILLPLKRTWMFFLIATYSYFSLKYYHLFKLLLSL